MFSVLYKWGLSGCSLGYLHHYFYWRKRAESTMKQKKLRRIDRCESSRPGTFVSILHFPSTGRKQWGGEEKKKKKAGSFLLNPTQREISLIMWPWLGCPGKSTLNQGDDGWLNIWNNGLIVIKMTVIKMDGSPCADGLVWPLVRFQNGCMLEWEVLSVSEKNRDTLERFEHGYEWKANAHTHTVIPYTAT